MRVEDDGSELGICQVNLTTMVQRERRVKVITETDILGHYSSISSEQSSAVIYIINVLVIIISLRTFVFCLQ